MKPLVVGQAPGRRAAPGDPALCGPNGSGARLARLCGLDRLTDAFDTVNLLDRFPGRPRRLHDGAAPGDLFPLAEAREAASEIDISERPYVLLLGLNVARAFGVPPVAFRWFALPACLDCYARHPNGRRFVSVAVVPHTSGLNRFYNDPENEARARTFLRTTLQNGPVYDPAGV